MIYITNTNASFKVPKSGSYEGPLTLVLRNIMAHTSTSLSVTDTSTNPYVYEFTLSQETVTPLSYGEYSYTLYAGTTLAATGLMRKVKRFPADTAYTHITPTVVYGDYVEVVTYTVSISALQNGYLLVNGQRYQEYTETLREGTNLQVVAVPDEHYTFNGWSDGVQTASRTIVVDSDIELTSAFAIEQYNVVITSNDTTKGNVVVNGVTGNYSETLPYGTTLTVTYSVVGEYEFNGWSDGVTDNPRTVFVGSDITLTAMFATQTFVVDISAGQNGTVSVNGVVGNYHQTVEYGTQLVIEATPDTGYDFVNWSDGRVTNPRTITVTAPVNLTSAYRIQSFAVNVVSEDTTEGNVVVNGTTGDYTQTVNYGTQLTLTVAPSQHYSFVMWSDGVISDTRTVTVTGPLSLTAVFTIDTYNVTITSGANGSVSVNGTPGNYQATLPYGTQLTVVGTPDTGYNFNSWSDGNTNATRTVIVDRDITLSASFAIQTFVIDVTAGANGMLLVNGSGPVSRYTYDQVPYGTVYTLEAVPDQDYEFTQWSDGNTDNPRTVTVTSNFVTTASFDMAFVPEEVCTIKYTTTDGQPDTTWVQAYDCDDHAMAPSQGTRYGRIAYPKAVNKVVFYGNNTLESVELPVLCQYFYDGDNVDFTSCKRLVINTFRVLDGSIYKFTAVEYAEVWAIDGGMAGLEVWPHGGERTLKLRSEVYDNGWGSWLGDWTYEPLGTTVKYEASEQVTLNDCNALNRNTYLNVVSHTFSDGVGTITYDGTVGELRDGWSDLPISKLIVPDTLGYFEYLWNDIQFDIEFGKHAGLVGGSMYASDTNQKPLHTRYVCSINVTFRPSNAVMFVGNDGCIYRNDWFNGNPFVKCESFTGQTYVQGYEINEFVMDDRCQDADEMFDFSVNYSLVNRFVLGTNCERIIFKNPNGWSDYQSVFSHVVINDALVGIKFVNTECRSFSGGANNLAFNVAQYYIESKNHNTLYYGCNTNVDLSGYTTLASYSFAHRDCGGAQLNLASLVELQDNALKYCNNTPATWTFPDTLTTVLGDYAFAPGGECQTLVFGTGLSYTYGSWAIAGDNLHTIIFKAMTAPSADGVDFWVGLQRTGDVWFPVGSTGYETYIDNQNILKDWTKHYYLPSNNKFAAKSVSGNQITNTPYIDGLTLTNTEFINGWTIWTFDNTITNYVNPNPALPVIISSDIETIVLPDTVTTIGTNSFAGLRGLSEITLPTNLVTIKDHAFSGCTSLEELVIPNTVTTIEDLAFRNCTSLEKVVFGTSLATIGSGNNDGIFDGCTSLNELVFKRKNGVTLGGGTFGSNIPATGTLYIPYGKQTEYAAVIAALPGWTVLDRTNSQFICTTYSGDPVAAPGSIGDKPLVSNDFENGVSIWEYSGDITFLNPWLMGYNVDLQSFLMPETITEIGDYSIFEGGLQTINIPASCRVINGWAFHLDPINNALASNTIEFPDTMEHIGAYAFSGFTGTTIKFGTGLYSLDGYTFKSDNLTDVYVYTEHTMQNNYGGNPFTDAPATGNLHLADGADYAFWTGYLPGWTVMYDVNPLRYTSTNSQVVTPYDATAFGNATIVSNTYANGEGRIVFNRPLTTVGTEAFKGCTTLASITLQGTVTTIGTSCFEGCTSLASITLPTNLVTIYDQAFKNTALTSVTIPVGVTRVNSETFAGCTSLTTVNFTRTAMHEYNLTHIRANAFDGCTSLSGITIPYSVTDIEEKAFRNCTSLTSVAIPQATTTIGLNPFEGCSGLTSITVNSNNTVFDGSGNAIAKINWYNGHRADILISGCQNTTVAPEVGYIGERAFYGITTLHTIDLGQCVMEVRDRAFYGCSGLYYIYMDNLTSPNEPTIGQYAYYGVDSYGTVFGKPGRSYTNTMAALPNTWNLSQ